MKSTLREDNLVGIVTLRDGLTTTEGTLRKDDLVGGTTLGDGLTAMKSTLREDNLVGIVTLGDGLTAMEGASGENQRRIAIHHIYLSFFICHEGNRSIKGTKETERTRISHMLTS